MPRLPSSPIVRVRWMLLVFAALQRVVFFFESSELPFMEAPLFDSAVYLRQAASITAGRFDDPALVAFGPLYGWFLAAVGSYVVQAQLVLGWLTTYLVGHVAARRSPAEGLAATALWIGYAVPLFYETKVMSETLGLFLTVLALAIFTSARVSRCELAASSATGSVLALATLTRANLLFALPLFVIAALVPRSTEARRGLARRAGGVALGMALVLSLNGAWNAVHFGRFVPVILTSRTASRASAHGEWTGSLAPLGGRDHPPSAWDVVRQAEVTLAAPTAETRSVPAIDFVGWATSSPAKLVRTFSDVETTFDYGFYGERSELPSLAWLPVSAGLLLLIGAIGAVRLARKEGFGALAAYLPLIIGVLVVTTLFHPSTRYRLSMMVPMTWLAAYALVSLGDLPEKRKRIAIAATALVSCALAVRHLTHPLASPAMWEVRVAEGEAVRGDVDAARARIARAVAYDDAAANERIRLLRDAHALPPP